MTNYEKWLTIKDKKIFHQVKNLTEKEKEENFSSSLAFGTAGIRGQMEIGTNKLNVVMVAKMAFALATYAKQTKQDNSGVAVCYDTRLNSKQFAQIFAKVFALKQFNIKTYFSTSFVPTPICVFAAQKYKTNFGVMVTASHNPKIYNGVKIYDKDQLQINKDAQKAILEIYNNLDEVECYNQIAKTKMPKTIKIDKNTIKEFVADKKDNTKKSLKVVYTPLHGTGRFAVSQIFANNGYKFFDVPSQKKADGNFPTCSYPNPEFEHAFAEALKVATKKDADVIIATDPDADRIGVMAKEEGVWKKLSGDEVGYLLLTYCANKNKNKNRFVVSSVVSSPLSKTICEKNNIDFFGELTGFLSLGTRMKTELNKRGNDAFVLCYEESCGYITKSTYLDKDGIYSALALCNIAQEAKNKNKTLFGLLDDIYKKYGRLETLQKSVQFEGITAFEDMQKVVEKIRKHLPKQILGEDIEKVTDYQKNKTGLDKQNFLKFESAKYTYIIRPSGTEPKLKIYMFAKVTKKSNGKTTQKMYEEILKDIIKM